MHSCRVSSFGFIVYANGPNGQRNDHNPTLKYKQQNSGKFEKCLKRHEIKIIANVKKCIGFLIFCHPFLNDILTYCIFQRFLA